MVVRSPVATGFYPEVSGVCKAAVERHLEIASRIQARREKIVAAIVPHAGWMYSGDTAAVVFSNIRRLSSPRLFLLFGSVHVPGVFKPAIMVEGAWETPLGSIEVDEGLARGLLKVLDGLLVEDEKCHLMEHSIEVQVPFIQHLFPDAKILPIMVPPCEDACALGMRAAEFLLGKDVMVVGTSDLTHYGWRYGLRTSGSGLKALEWVKNVNDKRVINLCLKMAPEEIVPEAAKNVNACGPGALAATVSYARAMGVTQGELLHYTTSYDVEPEGEPSNFVGYAGIVF